jgi:hypothetical protein
MSFERRLAALESKRKPAMRVVFRNLYEDRSGMIESISEVSYPALQAGAENTK